MSGATPCQVRRFTSKPRRRWQPRPPAAKPPSLQGVSLASLRCQSVNRQALNFLQGPFSASGKGVDALVFVDLRGISSILIIDATKGPENLTVDQTRNGLPTKTFSYQGLSLHDIISHQLNSRLVIMLWRLQGETRAPKTHPEAFSPTINERTTSMLHKHSPRHSMQLR